MEENGKHVGFSIDLLNAIAADIGKTVTLVRVDGFKKMLDSVQSGEVDGAIANISITSSREQVMDFTHPIFASGLQILLQNEPGSNAILSALFTQEIGIAILLAAGLLFGGGMLMWVFERGRQDYFNRPFSEAMFPSFWWALILVVNGGFEERVPRSVPGRFFGVILVISSKHQSYDDQATFFVSVSAFRASIMA
jgi:polar amino acid transport system substrate-binding protein